MAKTKQTARINKALLEEEKKQQKNKKITPTEELEKKNRERVLIQSRIEELVKKDFFDENEMTELFEELEDLEKEIKNITKAQEKIISLYKPNSEKNNIGDPLPEKTKQKKTKKLTKKQQDELEQSEFIVESAKDFEKLYGEKYDSNIAEAKKILENLKKKEKNKNTPGIQEISEEIADNAVKKLDDKNISENSIDPITKVFIDACKEKLKKIDKLNTIPKKTLSSYRRWLRKNIFKGYFPYSNNEKLSKNSKLYKLYKFNTYRFKDTDSLKIIQEKKNPTTQKLEYKITTDIPADKTSFDKSFIEDQFIPFALLPTQAQKQIKLNNIQKAQKAKKEKINSEKEKEIKPIGLKNLLKHMQRPTASKTEKERSLNLYSLVKAYKTFTKDIKKLDDELIKEKKETNSTIKKANKLNIAVVAAEAIKPTIDKYLKDTNHNIKEYGYKLNYKLPNKEPPYSCEHLEANTNSLCRKRFFDIKNPDTWPKRGKCRHAIKQLKKCKEKRVGLLSFKLYK